MLPFTLLEGWSLAAKTSIDVVSDPRITITSTQLILALSGLFLLNLLLRVFYLRYDFVNGDEGVRALSAVRMLEGARLYADVVTDKPPGASLFYAAVFAIFGRSMKAVHLAAAVWNFGTALVVFLIGSRFYTRRIGLWGGLFFVYFSTNYFTQDVMAANTELLMALPYAAAFYLFMVAREVDGNNEKPSASHFVALIAAGFLTGIAVLFKQIGVLNLMFFVIYEGLAVWRMRNLEAGSLTSSLRRAIGRLSLIVLGVAAVIASFVLWLQSIDALDDFWRNGILLSRAYGESISWGSWLRFLVGRGLGYVFFNGLLWALAGWAVWRALRNRDDWNEGFDARRKSEQERIDRSVALWCGVTLVSVMLGGRFFGHYFIPALPALSVLGARGLRLLIDKLRGSTAGRRSLVTVCVLAVLFAIGFIRSHHRTAVLAYETLSRAHTRWSANWGMTKREQEAEVVSQFVRTRVAEGEALYIWGYAHDVFWRTRCRPASRYLTPYYIDGRFPDAEDTVPASGEEFRREAALNLIEDLRRTNPRLLLDVEGNFSMLPHPELVAYLETNYRLAGNAGPDPARPFRAFELKNATAVKQKKQ